MDGSQTLYGTVNEAGTFSVLARVTSLDGTGEQVLPAEGNCLLQADVASVTAKVFNLGSDKDNSAGVEETPAPTITVAGSILDTLRTTGWPTNLDAAGYNFRHDIVPTYVLAANNWYLLEYKLTLLGGQVVWLRAKVKSVQIQTP